MKFIISLLFLFVLHDTRNIDSLPTASTKNTCGLDALYTLLKIERNSASFAQVQDALPSPSPYGYSMAELRDAAKLLEVKLIGVQLSTESEFLDRPALIMLQSESGGHYAVIRPVGFRGSLVQLIDSRGKPIICDANRLFRSKEWTGLALVPLRRMTGWYLKITIMMGLFSFLLLFVICGIRFFKKLAFFDRKI